jgi:monothiol glutaredoxin
MPRPILDETHIHPSVRDKLATGEEDIVGEVQRAVEAHDVVVVGMKQNPAPKRARSILRTKGVPFEYLEYGSYLGPWRKRNLLKMWTGWATFPMIFVKGTFIGGADDLARLIASGEFDQLLAGSRH